MTYKDYLKTLQTYSVNLRVRRTGNLLASIIKMIMIMKF